jgi:hypothetical protein
MRQKLQNLVFAVLTYDLIVLNTLFKLTVLTIILIIIGSRAADYGGFLTSRLFTAHFSVLPVTMREGRGLCSRRYRVGTIND